MPRAAGASAACLSVLKNPLTRLRETWTQWGFDLDQWVERDLLVHETWRPSQYGIEMHLLRIHKLVEMVKPRHVIIDPITNLISGSAQKDVYSMLMRLMDHLKGQEITAMFTSLTVNSDQLEQTDIGISSLTDTWLLCRDQELNGERNRCIYILKSRGMAHSNQVREFLMSRDGIRLVPPLYRFGRCPHRIFAQGPGGQGNG